MNIVHIGGSNEYPYEHMNIVHIVNNHHFGFSMSIINVAMLVSTVSLSQGSLN